MHTLLKMARKAYVGRGQPSARLPLTCQGQQASDLIRTRILAEDPCLVCRFGTSELNATLRYFEKSQPGGRWVKMAQYVRGDIGPYWWDAKTYRSMSRNAGFFPANDRTLARYSQQLLADVQQVDVLGSWLPQEVRLKHLLAHADLVPLGDLNPFAHEQPWSEALTGKKVLVVHPFSESIEKQYARHELLFADPRVLPPFTLKTLKAVQSIAHTEVGFKDWFEALDWMCGEIEAIDFDVALIGAGAYGLPLAAFVKRMGKKSVHLGGATQILFGIRGKRWDDIPSISRLYNEHWTRPLPSEIPNNASQVEAGCYW